MTRSAARKLEVPPGWEAMKRSKVRGCAVCHKPTKVSIALQARVIREDGRGVSNGLANCSISLCNEHALALWPGLVDTIESVRS